MEKIEVFTFAAQPTAPQKVLKNKKADGVAGWQS